MVEMRGVEPRSEQSCGITLVTALVRLLVYGLHYGDAHP